MAATKLNPAAAPFPCPYDYDAHHYLPVPVPAAAPPPFPCSYAHHIAPPYPLAADACCPPRSPFVTYHCVVASPHGGGHRIGLCFPVPQQQPSSAATPPPTKAGVLLAAAAPPPLPLPHGRPPHKLMAAFSAGACGGGAGKRKPPMKKPLPSFPAAAADVVVAPAHHQLVPAAAAAPPRKPRMARLKAERKSRSLQAKAYRPRKAAGPRAQPPPPSMYTKRPLDWVEPNPSELGECTTVMLRNIPNKLRSGDMISLLDEQCARANMAAGSVVAAYDVLYLPMDFSKEANFGYAFINFTTPAAAKELYLSLHNCVWKVHGSKKVIKIVPATQQGRGMLVRHLERMRLECANAEFLPVEFSPPRDGVNVAAEPRRIRMALPRRRGARSTAPKAAKA